MLGQNNGFLILLVVSLFICSIYAYPCDDPSDDTCNYCEDDSDYKIVGAIGSGDVDNRQCIFICGTGTFFVGWEEDGDCADNCPDGWYQDEEDFWVIEEDWDSAYLTGCKECSCSECEDCDIHTGGCSPKAGMSNVCTLDVPGETSKQCVNNDVSKYSFYTTDADRTANINDQCVKCKSAISKTIWTTATNDGCDDQNICTKNDICSSDGLCAGEELNCYNDGTNPLKNCEACNGSACVLQDTNSICTRVGDECGCSSTKGGVAATSYFETFSLGGGSIHDQCKLCTVSHSSCTSGNGADDRVCDDDDLCTLNDACASGQCLGEAYTCDKPACGVAQSAYPSGCDGTGSCVWDAESDGTVCDTKENECQVDSVCNGVLLTCPTKVNLPGTITKGNVVVHRPLDDEGITGGWLNNMDTFTISLTDWDVACDVLKYKVGMMKWIEGTSTCNAVSGKMWEATQKTYDLTNGITNAVYNFDKTLKDDGGDDFIAEGQTYAVIVEFENILGETTVGCSDAFGIDTSAPDVSSSVVKDLNPTLVFNDFATSTDVDKHAEHKIHATWSEVAEASSGWLGNCHYRWAIGTSSGGIEIQDFTNVADGYTNAGVDVPSMEHGVTYFVTVEAYNLAGLTSRFSSNGFMADFTGPAPLNTPFVESTLEIPATSGQFTLITGAVKKDDLIGGSTGHYVFTEESGGQYLIKSGTTTDDVTQVASVSNSITEIEAVIGSDDTLYIATVDSTGAVSVYGTATFPTQSESVSSLKLFIASNDDLYLIFSMDYDCSCGKVKVPIVYKYSSGSWTALNQLCPASNDTCEDFSLQYADYNVQDGILWVLKNSSSKSVLLSLDISGTDFVEAATFDELLESFVGIGDVGVVAINESKYGLVSWPESDMDETKSDAELFETGTSYILRGDYASRSLYLATMGTDNDGSAITITKHNVGVLENTPIWSLEIPCKDSDSLLDMKLSDEDSLMIWSISRDNKFEMQKIFVGRLDDNCLEAFGVGSNQQVKSSCLDGLIADPLFFPNHEILSNIDIDYDKNSAWIRAKWIHFSEPDHFTVSYGSNDDYNNVLAETDVGLARSFIQAFPSEMTVTNGVEYKFIVRAYSDTGTFTQLPSDGIRFDLTDPVAESVIIHSRDHSDSETESVWVSDSHVGFHAKFYDIETSILEMEWCIRSESSDTCDVMDWISVGSITKAQNSSEHFFFKLSELATPVTLSDGQKIKIAVKAINGVGLMTESVSNVATVDSSTPEGGEVLDIKPDTTGDQRVDVIAHNLSFHEADWSGFTAVSGKSPITEYMYTIAADDSSAETGGIIGEWVSVGTVTTMKRAADSTSIDKGKFYVYVRCYNAAGNYKEVKSNGVFIAQTPPTIDSLSDGSTPDIGDLAFLDSSDTVSAFWTLTTPTDLKTMQFGVGDCTAKTHGVLDLEDISDLTSRSIDRSGLTLVFGQLYCSHLFIEDLAGNSAEAWTNGFRIDVTAPTIKTLVDGLDVTTDIDDLKPHLGFSVAWSEINDNESGILSVNVCVGSATDNCDKIDWTPVPGISSDIGVKSSSTYTFANTADVIGEFVVNMKILNNAAKETVISTDGFRADNTAPYAGTVTHSLQPVDVTVSSSLTTLEARWSDFSGVSPIVDFTVKVDTSDGTEVVAATSVGTATFATFDNLSLTTGTTYVVTVTATNAIDLSTPVASGGVRIDTTPTTAVSVSVLDNVDYVSSSSSIDVEWEFGEEVLADLKYKYAIGTSAGSTSELDWTEETRTSFTIDGLTLASGQKYYLSVAALSDAHLESIIQTSQPFIVDTTTPSPGSVWDKFQFSDAEFQSETDSMIGYWSGFMDQVSNIRYEVGIGNTVGVADVVDFASITPENVSENGTSQEDIVYKSTITASLGDGTYYFVVKCLDEANNFVIVSSSGVTVDSSVPVPSTVYDGSEYHVDADFSNSLDTVCASWDAFTDNHSGIRRYRWAIFADNGNDNLVEIMPLTSVGLSTIGKATGLTLETGQEYVITVEGMNGAKLTSTSKSDGFFATAKGSATAFEVTSHVYLWGGDAESVSDRVTCTCKDSSTTFYPSLSECVCPNTHYFDARTQACTACGDGLFNTDSKDICSADSDTSATFPSSITLPTYDPCDTPVDGFVKNDSDECVCKPGKYLNDENDCVLCPEGTYKYLAGNDYALCSYCPPSSQVLVLEMPITDDNDPSTTEESEFVYSVGTTVRGEQWVNMGSKHKKMDMKYEFALPWSQETQYYVQVEGINQDGITSVRNAISEVIDTTPPLKGSCFDGKDSLNGVDSKYQSDNTSISASWFGFTEDVSTSEVKYLVGVGSEPGTHDISGDLVDVGQSTKHTFDFSSSALPDDKYFVTVTAINTRGLATSSISNGILIDTTVPAGVVIDGNSSVDVDYQNDMSTISASWMIDDNESGITLFEWSIGTESDEEEIMSFTSVGLSTSGSAEDLTLIQGTKYIITVRAYNGAGSTSKVKSNGVTIDSVLPTISDLTFIPVADDLPEGLTDLQGTIKYQNKLDQIDAEWKLTKSLTPISFMKATFGKCPYGAHSVFEESVTIDENSDTQGVSFTTALEHGGRYCLAVEIETESGVNVRSRSTESILIDSTPSMLSGISIEDLTMSVTTGEACISMTWDLASDSESQLLNQSLIVCVDEDCANTSDMIVFSTIHYSLNDGKICSKDLDPGTQYWGGIRVINAAHGVSYMVTPFRLDTTPPSIVFDSRDTFIAEQGSLKASWTITDDESEIESVLYTIVDDDDKLIVDWIDAGIYNEATAEVYMTVGKSYRFRIEATNSAGLSATEDSDATLFDNTAPSKGTLCIDAPELNVDPVLARDCNCICCDDQSTNGADKCNVLYVGKAVDKLVLRWFGQVDDESGVESFDGMLGTSAIANQISPWFKLVVPNEGEDGSFNVPTQLNNNAVLVKERSQIFTLRSTSGSGVSSVTRSQQVILDPTGPECGTSLNIDSAIFSSANQLDVEISWDEECIDYESGLAGMSVTDTEALTPMVTKLSQDPMKYSTTINTTNATDGDMISFVVDMFNHATVKTTMVGSLTLDLSPPVVSIVRDGPRPDTQLDRDIDCIDIAADFGVNWDSFTDSSEITSYEVALGTCVGCDDIVPFKYASVGDGTRSVRFGDLSKDVSIGKIYYASVRATNSFGLSSTASSDGVRVVCTSDDDECTALIGAYKCVSF